MARASVFGDQKRNVMAYASISNVTFDINLKGPTLDIGVARIQMEPKFKFDRDRRHW
jgi:hypothetical protein